MRKLYTLVLAVALLAAACGDDDAATTTTDDTTASTTGETTTTEGMTTTTGAVTTTTEAMTTTTEAMTTTTADPAAMIAALAEAYAGSYTGEWVNTTFGSTGPIEWSLALGDGSIDIVVDLGGGVFGAGDPDPEEFSIPFDDLAAGMGGATVSSEVFGVLEATIGDDGSVEVFGGEVPGSRIGTITITGTFIPGAADLEYLIEFEDGGTAEGTATFARS